MSLVNDMLRDLDARRRDVPTHGAGAEKLVPAGDTSGGSARGQGKAVRVAIALGLIVVVAGGAFFYWLQESGNTAVIPPVRMVEPGVTPLVEDSSQDLAAMRMLEERLRQLEQQNQRLLSLQAEQLESATASVSNPAPVQQGNWQETEWAAAVEEVPVVDLQQIAETALSGQQAAQQAPVTISQSATPSTPATLPVSGEAGVIANPTRSPRELSFSDQDRQQVQRSLEQWSNGQRLTALQTLDSFIYDNPQAHQSRETLAKLLIQQGEQERAMQAVDVGLAIAPNHAGYRKVKARLLIASARAAEAVQLLDAARPSVAIDPEYHDVLATALLSGQDYERAAQTYRALLQQDQTTGRWWYGMAASYDALGRTQEAGNAYEQALQQSNLTPGLRQNSQQRLAAIRQN